ncbi:MAG: hypothetical protein E7116_04450 [Bacteroidales bacterium]|nr:hypothetical protein [Bacteroidales bacterium]
MSRKTLILCLAVLSAMFLALGIAVAFLYSGTGDKDRGEVSLKDAESCLAAIPSDAVLVGCSSRLDKACKSFLSSFALPDSLYADMERGDLASLRKSPMAVSLHYSGKLIPLYVFDLDGVSETAADVLLKRVESLGCRTQKNGRFFLASESEALVKSASRHIDIKVSVVDAPGFADAIDAAQGDIRIFVPHLQIQKLLSAVGGRTISRHSQFLERTADWCAFDLRSDDQTPFSLRGSFVYDGDTDEFLTVLQDCTPSASYVADVLPSYTFSAVSIPVEDMRKYISAYKSFVDSRQRLQDFTARQSRLGESAGISPEELFNALNVKEIATASFKVAGKMEKVNLIRTGSKNAGLIFKGNDVSSLRGYEPAVHSWAYSSFAASVFGELFAIKDETCFTYIDGWIISGSKAAIEDYVKRKSLNYNLGEYLSDAGKEGLLSGQPALVQIYLSLSEDKDEIGACLKPVAIDMIEYAEQADYSPVVLTLCRDKHEMTFRADLYDLALKKSKAPEFERDTTVVVPSGPYKVKNSHTGKMNTFYQNEHNSLCLRDENGKDLWGVPFDKKICGTASNVDYYANGKLQIIFGAGSQIYIIDRLGRYVNGFPLELGKEILLGPDLYDFSGARKYNIMVLHKDKTVEMYNLKGKKPDSWKGISSSETIKSLPEQLVVGGKNFWVVRTSVQTLIYPFYGGEPITVFEGDEKIRPDSEVRKVDESSVQVSCYDGKTRTVKIK